MDGLIFVPLEIFEERYTKQWYYWFMNSFNKNMMNPIVVGDTKERPISCGQFLDVYQTNMYKMEQMYEIIEHVKNGFEGTIFFMDMWFPGLEALGYLKNCTGKNIKIKGMLHAGTWDEWDYLSQSGMGKWAKDLEVSWMKLADEVFVATDFHKNLIEDYLGRHTKITVVDFPVYRNDEWSESKKEDIVAFPHRLAPEKQPEVFRTVESMYHSKYNAKVDFVRCKDLCEDKVHYYDMLSMCKVAFSSALQETFGIAMLEAVSLGCVPVAPNRLSYKETLKEFKLYDSLEEAVDMIHEGIINYQKPTPRYVDNVDNIVRLI